MAIIGIIGRIGCGKDTAASYFSQQKNYTRVSFASSLKDTLSAIFGWDRSRLEGLNREDRKWREQVDPWWSARLGIPELSPRWAMQRLGTDVLRNHFHDSIWVASLENKLRNLSDVVVTDCRYLNEYNMIKNAGGKVLLISRGSDPDWVDIAKAASTGDRLAINELTNRGIHSSEWSWASITPDYYVKNDGTIIELYSQLSKLDI